MESPSSPDPTDSGDSLNVPSPQEPEGASDPLQKVPLGVLSETKPEDLFGDIDATGADGDQGDLPEKSYWDAYRQQSRKESADSARETLDKVYQQHVNDFAQDLDARKRYAGRLFLLMCGSLALLFVVILLDGLGNGGSVSFSPAHPWWSLLGTIICFILAGAIGKDELERAPVFEPPTNDEGPWQRRRRKERNQRVRNRDEATVRVIERIQWSLVSLGAILSLPALGEWLNFEMQVAGFDVETAALVALATGVTVQVILVFNIVAKSLFPKRKGALPYKQMFEEMRISQDSGIDTKRNPEPPESR